MLPETTLVKSFRENRQNVQPPSCGEEGESYNPNTTAVLPGPPDSLHHLLSQATATGDTLSLVSLCFTKHSSDSIYLL